MTVTEFVEEFKTLDKENPDSKYLSISYLPYEEKMAIATIVVDRVNHVDVAGKKVFKANTPMKYMLFVLHIIDTYTVIDIDFSNIFNEYNALEEVGASDYLFALIPEKELDVCNLLFDMMFDDMLTNERDIVSYIETKVDAVSILANSLLDELKNNPDIVEQLKSAGEEQLDKITK